MKTECKICTVMCDILSGNELRTCAFEHKSICPFDARYLDLSEHDKQVRADVIDEFADKCIELQRALFVNPSVRELDIFKIWLCNVAEQLKEE